MALRPHWNLLVLATGLGASLALAGTARADGVELIDTLYIVPENSTQGHHVDANQFRTAGKEEMGCGTAHYHARSMGKVTALDGTEIPDPKPMMCGYGKVGTIRKERIVNWDAVGSGLDDDHDGIADTDEMRLGLDPTKADSDGNGIPDGLEDLDNDGLQNGRELYVTMSDPRAPSSITPGVKDGFAAINRREGKRTVVIPVFLINYRNSGADLAHFRNAIEIANRILKQINVRLQLAGGAQNVTAGDDGSGGGTAGDGKFTEAEAEKVQRVGYRILKQLPLARRGLLVSTAGELNFSIGNTPQGASGHRYPAMICRQRDQLTLTGATLAHELLHILTLKGHPDPGTEEGMPGNLMVPSNKGRDDFVLSEDPDKGVDNLVLTDAQKAQVKVDAIEKALGLTGRRRSPFEKEADELAHADDDLDDVAVGQPSYLDLDGLIMRSSPDEEFVHILLYLDEPFPADEDVNAIVRILFDLDADAGTGFGQTATGYEQELFFRIERNDETNGLQIVGEILDGVSFDSQILVPDPAVREIVRMSDSGEYEPVHVRDMLEILVPRERFAFEAEQIPVLVHTQANAFGAVADEMAATYDRMAGQNTPTLTVPVEFGTPGESVDFAVEGLTPDAAFDLLLDDQVVFSGVLDGDGDADGQFLLDVGEETAFYFLTAIDAEDEFASSAIAVDELVFSDSFEGFPPTP